MRRRVLLVVSALLAALVGLLTPLPALASGPAGGPPGGPPHHLGSYVALGDSYSAAAGVLPQVPGSPPACSRSLLNYPHDVAAALHPWSFTDVSCSGAATSDLFAPQPGAGVPPQLAAVHRDTQLVTLTLGGNDDDLFGTLAGACVAASAASLKATGSITGDPCAQQYGASFDVLVTAKIQPALVAALTAVHRRAPHAAVLVLGYPRVLPDVGVPSCYPAMPISLGDVPYVVGVERTLNSAVAKAAAETGSRFVDMWPSSAGHDACQPPARRWVEPLVHPVNAAPAHPNARGEAGMARQVLASLHD